VSRSSYVSRSIARSLDNSALGERPDWRERPYRALFLRPDRIGDMIYSTGILRAIAERCPTIEMHVLASPLNAPVLRQEPFVRDVVLFDRRRWLTYPSVFAELRRRSYDVVVDGQLAAPSLSTLLLMRATRAAYRIGVARRGEDAGYTLRVPPRETQDHVVDRLGALVAAFGLEPSGLDLSPRIELSAAERERGERVWRGETDDRQPGGPRLLVNASARSGQQWPDSRFVALIQTVREQVRGAKIVVISSPRDRARAALIAAEGGARMVEDQGLRDAFAIVAQAHVVFAPDSSMGYACSALDRPAVLLYPRGRAASWGPYKTAGRALESATDSLADIPADHASREVVRLVTEAQSRSSAGG
jgi:ADP-heptose:LPS heptosyltransferase